MGTTIHFPVQNLDAWRNNTLPNRKVAKSLEKAPEQPGLPKKALKADESQVHDLDRANDPKDLVEIQNFRQQLIEANQASLENRVKDIHEAQKLLQETVELLNSEKGISQVALVHDFSQLNLLHLSS